jgi:hypothetical protein
MTIEIVARWRQAASAREDFELLKRDAGSDELVLDVWQQHDGDTG